MRILLAAHNYPRFAGDAAGFYVRRLALGFAARGHRVSVVAPHAPGTAEHEREAGVQVHRFRYAPEWWERVGYRGEARAGRLLLSPSALAIPGYLLAFRSALRDMIRQLTPDLVHAHWWLPAGWLAAGTAPALVVTSHGSDVRLLDRNRWLRRVARGVARQANAWTAVSRFLARDLETLLALPPSTVPVTPMPVDTALFEQGLGTPKVSPPRILYAGNLVASKGVDVLVTAFLLLRQRGIEASLRLLGAGPAKPALQAQVEQAGLTSHVTFQPFVPQSAMPAEYAAATVTVLPSRGQAEGLGLTLVEALLAGSAVVGTPAGGIPEVVEHAVTGLLVPDGDHLQLTEALARLLTERDLRERLTTAGRERVRQLYSTETAVGRFLGLFDDVLQHPTRG